MPRAVISGILIGGVMSISPLYVGLKTGWGLGVKITSCAAWKRRVGRAVPDTPGEYDFWFYKKREQAKEISDAPPRSPTAENMHGPSRVWTECSRRPTSPGSCLPGHG